MCGSQRRKKMIMESLTIRSNKRCSPPQHFNITDGNERVKGKRLTVPPPAVKKRCKRRGKV